MPKKLLTLVIPTFNRKDMVVKNLENIIDQKLHEHFEVIIVDNNSSDGTYHDLLNISKQYSNISVFKNETNIGFIGSVLSFFKLVDTEFFLINSDEDFFIADGVFKVEEILKNNEDVAFLSGNVLEIDDAYYRRNEITLNYKNLMGHGRSYISGQIFNVSKSLPAVDFIKGNYEDQFIVLYPHLVIVTYLYASGYNCLSKDIDLTKKHDALETFAQDFKGRAYWLLDSRLEQYRSYIYLEKKLLEEKNLDPVKVKAWCDFQLKGFFNTSLIALQYEKDPRILDFFKKEAAKFPFIFLKSKVLRIMPRGVKNIVKSVIRKLRFNNASN